MQLHPDSDTASTCVSYLIIDHHMHSAMSGVGGQVRQVEGFVDYTLSCKGSITVKKDGHHLNTHPLFHEHQAGV